MSEPAASPPTPYPQHRTPEQHEAVRRRALPVAVCAALLGIAGLMLQLTTSVGVNRPPSLLGVNLSFCAILMGAGILLYARGTPGTGNAAIASVIAILMGMAGPMVFAKQTVEHHRVTEERELQNVRDIAVAGRKYAETHDGRYPQDLLVMLEENLLAPADLQSPLVFGKKHDTLNNLATVRKTMSREQLLRAVEEDSDYLYAASDVKVPLGGTAKTPPAIIVACSNTTVMRTHLALSFVDQTSRFITVDDIDKVMADCNAGRAELGLPPLRPPPIIEHAIEEAASRPG